MVSEQTAKEQISKTIKSIDLEIPNSKKIEGKVRDCYVLNDNTRLLIATDRLSAFDVILTTIPFKGQVLTQMAKYWFDKTTHILPNHIISYPHPNIMHAKEVKIIPIEVVVRAYLAGSAYRDYQAGKEISGVSLPSGMKKSEKLPQHIVTPSTKEEKGNHDVPISEKEIIARKIVSAELWENVRTKALELFNFGSIEAEKKGFILVDTKYEFGLDVKTGELTLADEIHTPDSSRYWLKESYQERFNSNQDPEMLDKEFVRRELIKMGFMGDGEIPTLSDDFKAKTATRYIEVYEKITGETFTPAKEISAKEIITAIS